MVTVTSIDGSELAALLNWPEEAASRLPSALWLPAEVDDEKALVTTLGSAWELFDWYGMGTWFAPVSKTEPPMGLADRYGDLQVGLIAEGALTTPRGLRVRTEWSSLNPLSNQTHEFLTDTRKARGSGSCVALMPRDVSPRAWYAASTAMLHRGLLAFGGIDGADREHADRSASLTYLAAGSAAGYASLVPLDHHPWGGYVVVAAEPLCDALRDALPDRLPGLAGATSNDVVSRAGSLAL